MEPRPYPSLAHHITGHGEGWCGGKADGERRRRYCVVCARYVCAQIESHLLRAIGRASAPDAAGLAQLQGRLAGIPLTVRNDVYAPCPERGSAAPARRRPSLIARPRVRGLRLRLGEEARRPRLILRMRLVEEARRPLASNTRRLLPAAPSPRASKALPPCLVHCSFLPSPRPLKAKEKAEAAAKQEDDCLMQMATTGDAAYASSLSLSPPPTQSGPAIPIALYWPSPLALVSP
ncbi:hypothetical protein C8R45DRAFT_1113593 [Mycena sanguinolenta]|nr:hypothetical protein C8R45DRAFT_1113593 [Mycena sanguinolenta]